jgi:hypothetical protein
MEAALSNIHGEAAKDSGIRISKLTEDIQKHLDGCSIVAQNIRDIIIGPMPKPKSEDSEKAEKPEPCLLDNMNTICGSVVRLHKELSAICDML